MTTYTSTIGKLLYVGHPTSRSIAFQVSQASPKCPYFQLHHLTVLNITVETLKNQSATINYCLLDSNAIKLEAILDAEMNDMEDKTNDREGVVILCRSGNIVHGIAWTLNVAKRVARSTDAAELLVAAVAVDQIYSSKHLLEELTEGQTAELIHDFGTAFRLCSTLKQPMELGNKIFLPSLREEHHKASMNSIRSTPGQTHLPDALSKYNQVIAKL